MAQAHLPLFTFTFYSALLKNIRAFSFLGKMVLIDALTTSHKETSLL